MEPGKIFTEAEKHDIIGYIVERKSASIDATFCPFFHIKRACERCAEIFPRIKSTGGKIFRHPCSCYSKKYVKQKFWKAME